jgi:hypothetical protein
MSPGRSIIRLPRMNNTICNKDRNEAAASLPLGVLRNSPLLDLDLVIHSWLIVIQFSSSSSRWYERYGQQRSNPPKE